jgi:hypothetical protein
MMSWFRGRGAFSLRIRPMRRWLIVSFMLLMQVQFVWAAAAAYCGHETSAAASAHFGHHEHRHQGGGIQSTDDAGKGIASLHLDCESCHFGTSANLPSPAITIAELPEFEFRCDCSPRYTSHVTSTPERPDRVSHQAAA